MPKMKKRVVMGVGYPVLRYGGQIGVYLSSKVEKGNTLDGFTYSGADMGWKWPYRNKKARLVLEVI